MKVPFLDLKPQHQAIRTEVLAGRNLFWCPTCQAPGARAD